MECEAGEMQHVVGMALKLASSGGQGDVYKCFKLLGNKLYATNCASCGEFNLPEGIVFDEEVLVDARQMSSVVKYLTGKIAIIVETGRIQIKDGRGEYKLLRASGAMATPEDQPDDDAFVHANHIVPCLLIAKTYVSSGTNAIRAFEGIILKGGEIIASDGEMMFHTSVEAETGPAVILSAQEIPVLHKATQTKIGMSSGRVYFKYKDAVISVPQVNAQYPRSVHSVIDSGWDVHCEIDRQEIHNAIRQCLSLANSEDSTFIKVNLEGNGEKMSVESHSPKGEILVNIACSAEHPISCSINGFMFNKFLSNAHTKSIGISKCSSGRKSIRCRSRLPGACGDNIFGVFIGEVGTETTGEQNESPRQNGTDADQESPERF